MSKRRQRPPRSPRKPNDRPRSPAERTDPPDGGEGQRQELLRLASVIAHQLRSPLSSVQAVLSSVLGGFAGPLDARQRWLLEKAWQRCAKGTNLVRDLMRLRTVEQLDDEALGPVNLVAAFGAAVDAVRETARERTLELQPSVEVADADVAWILGEPTLVREILQVLLDNAVKYTPDGGRVSARLGLAKADDGDASRALEVEIVDSGIGITPEGYEHLFEEFYRAPNAKKISEEGTGLGLAFARRASGRLGGTIRIEPSPSGGVRAVASFPQRLDFASSAGTVSWPEAVQPPEVSQRVVIVGGVTAGAKAASRIMRLDPAADVTIVERGRFLAYSGCGLPFYISGAVSEQRALLESPLGLLRDSFFFHKLKNVRALDLTEAVRIDREHKRLVVRNLLDQRQRELPYDRLILATGARPVIPDTPGVGLDGVHTLHGVEDAEAIRSRLGRPRVKDVVIVGGGLLGCQITESVAVRGARLTLVEERPSILRILDEEIAALVRGYLEAHGIRVLCGHRVQAFEGRERVEAVLLEDGTRLPCDFVLLSLGRKPDVDLAREAGLEIGPTGAIRADRLLRTSDPDIFAAGDCVEQSHVITGKPVWIPGAVSASIQGRVAANNVCGGKEECPAVAGTAIVKLFDWTAGRAGLTEREAQEAGFEPISAVIPGADRAHFISSARSFVLKVVADGATGRVLGGQGVGPGDVAKRLDVLATAAAAGMDVDALAHLNLAYAPPFSTAVDKIHTAANALRNKREGRYHGISAVNLRQRMIAGDPIVLLDVRQPVEYGNLRLKGSRHVPLGSLRGRLHELPHDKPIVIVCSLGLRSYEASLILSSHGFKDVLVLDGGLEAWPYPVEHLT